MTKLKPLPWYGGKQARGKAQWIAGLLPDSPSEYVEPFAGMCSVLLARKPAKGEIINDLDLRVVNWWRVLRDMPDEFAHKVRHLPLSRHEWERSKEIVDDMGVAPVDRAVAFHCLAIQTSRQNMVDMSTWMRVSAGKITIPWHPDRTYALADRMRKVALECRPASDILAWTADRPDALIYADPPYVGVADTGLYHKCEVDISELKDLFAAQAGAVAISGYGDVWDDLGWEVEELITVRESLPGEPAGVDKTRVERLWRNENCVRLWERENALPLFENGAA